MRTLSLSLAVVFGLATIGFAGVNTDSDPKADFSQCKTYQWAKTGQEAKDPFMAERITEDVDAQLAARGWTKATDGTCYVAYHVAVTEQRGASIQGFGGWRFGGGMGDIQSYTIKQGELTVGVYSPAKKMMWQGSATETLKSKPDKVGKQIEKDVKKMFEKFPPK